MLTSIDCFAIVFGFLPETLSMYARPSTHTRVHTHTRTQAMIQNAIEEWRTAMAAVEAEPDPVLRHQQVQSCCK